VHRHEFGLGTRKGHQQQQQGLLLFGSSPEGHGGGGSFLGFSLVTKEAQLFVTNCGVFQVMRITIIIFIIIVIILLQQRLDLNLNQPIRRRLMGGLYTHTLSFLEEAFAIFDCEDFRAENCEEFKCIHQPNSRRLNFRVTDANLTCAKFCGVLWGLIQKHTDGGPLHLHNMKSARSHILLKI